MYTHEEHEFSEKDFGRGFVCNVFYEHSDIIKNVKMSLGVEKLDSM